MFILVRKEQPNKNLSRKYKNKLFKNILLNSANNKNNKFKIKNLQKRKDKELKRSHKMLKAKIKYLNKSKYHSR